MRFQFLILSICLVLRLGASADSKDDFSEFDAPEDFDVPVPVTESKTTPPLTTESTPVKEEKEEFSFDEEEFPQSEDEEFAESPKAENKEPLDFGAEKKDGKIKPLTFADIPNHFRSNWSSYQVETVVLILIFIYGLNFVYGKTTNNNIALRWFSSNEAFLLQQFAVVGDDGLSSEAVGGKMMKDTEHSYSIWSSGRVGVRGLFSQLKLRKRQDLVGVFINKFITPTHDRVIHRFELDPNEMDSFVLAFGLRKSLGKIVKEYADITTFAVEKKNVALPVSSNFAFFVEVSESLQFIFDQTTLQFMKRYERYIDYFHFSDQYYGPKTQEEVLSRMPETTPTLIFSLNVFDEDDFAEVQEALLQFVFHTVDRIRRYRLSREGKIKTDKNRKAFEENFLKNTHLQRQEAAQARREEKTRERKQRMLEEEDPDKQRKLQKIEAKKESKMKQPKVKQLRVK